MALREPLMYAYAYGTSGLALRADVGESLLVKNVYVYSPTDEWVTLRIEKTTVGFFRISETYGTHLHFPIGNEKPKNILGLCYDLGIFTGYPVAEGETFYVLPLSSASSIIAVEYQIYDAGDKKAEDPNGSKSKEYFFINYGDTGAAISAAGDHLYDRCLNPIEFPAFPFAADVPAKTRITIHGICGKEVCVYNSTPALAIHTNYLRLVYERMVLFDKDRNGIIFRATEPEASAGTYAGRGYSKIGNFDHLDRRPPLIFESPLTFDSGEELNIYVNVSEPVDGSSIPTAYQVIGLIETVKRE